MLWILNFLTYTLQGTFFYPFFYNDQANKALRGSKDDEATTILGWSRLPAI